MSWTDIVLLAAIGLALAIAAEWVCAAKTLQSVFEDWDQQ